VEIFGGSPKECKRQRTGAKVRVGASMSVFFAGFERVRMAPRREA